VRGTYQRRELTAGKGGSLLKSKEKNAYRLKTHPLRKKKGNDEKWESLGEKDVLKKKTRTPKSYSCKTPVIARRREKCEKVTNWRESSTSVLGIWPAVDKGEVLVRKKKKVSPPAERGVVLAVQGENSLEAADG